MTHEMAQTLLIILALFGTACFALMLDALQGIGKD